MILGIGNDIIEIKRIEELCNRMGFPHRIFTQKEIDLFSQSIQSLAGNFTAKEAIVKAMGTGFRGFYPESIEIIRDEYGKPIVSFYGKAKDIFEKMGKPNVFVTISHCRKYAMATCVLEI